MFSANAPGWTAKVVKTDEVGGAVRATVAFGGMGPDGKEMVQHGAEQHHIGGFERAFIEGERHFGHAHQTAD